MRTITIAGALTLSACMHANAPMPPDGKEVNAEQLDKVTDAVATCPQIRPLLAGALVDDRVTIGEMRRILRRMAYASAESDRFESYDRARDAVGMRRPARGPSCDPRAATDLYSLIAPKT